MVRGLDGCFLILLPHTWLVQFSSSTERLAKFRWCIAKGRHLFPFRTEQLSLSAPMVLGGQPPGRVGRRRFFVTDKLSRLRAALCRSKRWWETLLLGGMGGLGWGFRLTLPEKRWRASASERCGLQGTRRSSPTRAH